MIKKVEFQCDESRAREEYKKGGSLIRVALESAFGLRLFMAIRDRIQIFDDVLLETKTDILVRPYALPTSLLQKSINAHWKAVKIAEAYNEGTPADFDNDRTNKFMIQRDVNHKLIVESYKYTVYGPSNIYFNNFDNAKDAISKFKEVYEDYLMVKAL